MKAVSPGRGKRVLRAGGGLALLGLVVAMFGMAASRVDAVPSFARQTKLPCSACHIGGFGPQLTSFGRQFKLMGYTMKTGDGPDVPLSAMLVESFTHTAKAQTDPPADGFSRNNNAELQQASVFLAGRVSQHVGVFAQATYSENGGLLGWDNMDVRYANSFTSGAHNAIWGVSLNNNPTVTDVFNTAPAWQFPYMGADLAPGAPAMPMLFGGLGGQVIGVNGYLQLDGKWYGEVGAYRSLSPSFLRDVNADFDGRLASTAPYARLAYTWNLPAGNVELGGFYLHARRGLPGTNAAGNAVAVAGPSDRFDDLGVDASYQRAFGSNHLVTVNALYVDERQKLDATYGSGGSSNLNGRLDALNLDGSYWYRNTWGATLDLFADNGRSDTILYGDAGKPDTRGGTIEADWNPFGESDSWEQPWANVRVGLEYTFYTRFAGRVHNVDGAGRSASDNNTTYLYVWLAI
ncbi:cytochrome C [Dyella lutea]|uniref:Cytochrome C n=1 Tax=Dyella lutea TaxID=2950441 RepID=A0ABT1F7G4_9GAMM|nr:cytochrome C [Dyella lutea]MCP1373313.1 cytochrome C [Dyella lutea]